MDYVYAESYLNGHRLAPGVGPPHSYVRASVSIIDREKGNARGIERASTTSRHRSRKQMRRTRAEWHPDGLTTRDCVKKQGVLGCRSLNMNMRCERKLAAIGGREELVALGVRDTDEKTARARTAQYEVNKDDRIEFDRAERPRSGNALEKLCSLRPWGYETPCAEDTQTSVRRGSCACATVVALDMGRVPASCAPGSGIAETREARKEGNKLRRGSSDRGKEESIERGGWLFDQKVNGKEMDEEQRENT
ncbi:hypothetical protein K438DRAFT_1757872 [Mycena galopus ATCC 62051]|nr:hypothetical protein K438DRAFT_1757872 [Mycena galopus ATCC 62051]